MSGEFSMFGYGQNGVPGEADAWLSQPGEVDRLAQEAISACKATGDRRRRSPGDQWATLMWLVVAWHSNRKMALPSVVLEALAHVMGLVSYVSHSPVPDKRVVERLGLPAKIESWSFDRFLVAAKLDGEADAAGMRLSASALAAGMIDLKMASLPVNERTIREWRKFPSYQRRRTFAAAFAESTPGPARGINEQTRWVRVRLGLPARPF